MPGYAQDESGSLEKVTLRMSWFPYADYSVYVIGLEKGFYKDEGLDVTMVPTKGSGLTTKLIGAGDAQFASASADATLIARTKGMPLKVLATLHQTSPTSVFSMASKGIETLKDLQGRTLASDPNSLKHKQFIAACRINGVDIDAVKIQPIKGSNFVHIIEDKADAMLAFGYIGDAMLRDKGYDVNEIKLNERGVDIYSISLITNDSVIEKNPDLVERFVRATIKSWNYAVNHPEETLEAFIAKYPDLNRDDERKQVLGVIDLMQSEYTKEHGYGYQSEEKWKATQDLLIEQGVIDERIDINEVYTNEFLK